MWFFFPAAVNILHDEIPGSHFQSFIIEVVIDTGECQSYWTFCMKQKTLQGAKM